MPKNKNSERNFKRSPIKGNSHVRITDHSTYRLLLLNKIDYVSLTAFVLCLLFTVAGIIVSVLRYRQYSTFFFDFGIFDQALWQIAHFQPPITEQIVVEGKWIFADHFYPSLFLLSPLYWFTNNQEAMLIAQAIIVGCSAVVLFLIARKLLESRLLALAILVNYLLFIGLQNAVITGFYDLTIMTFPLMLTIWAFVNSKKKLYFLFLLLTLGCKETTFLLGIAIGVVVFLSRRQWKKEAAITVLLSLLWGVLAIHFIVPYFSGGIYQYTLLSAHSPIEYATRFIDDPEKRHTLLYSFASFGFLPLLSPPFYLAILQDYASRFYTVANTRWGLGFHYNAQSAVILSLASVYGLSYVQRFKRFLKVQPILAIILILNSVVLYRFILRGPFALAYNKVFYTQTKNVAYLDRMVAQVPSNAVVMTQNDLGAHFTHQRYWYLRTDYESKNPDYILFNIIPGQNQNDFYPSSESEANSIFTKVKTDPNYNVIYQTDYQYIFKKR